MYSSFTPRLRSIEERINDTTGPFIEVAGPSRHWRTPPFLDAAAIAKPMIVTNIHPNPVERPIYGSHVLPGKRSGEPPHNHLKYLNRLVRTEIIFGPNGLPILEPVDMKADLLDLPFRDGSVGAIFGSALHVRQAPDFLQTEAPRTLEPGGVVVLERIEDRTVQYTEPYFSILNIRKTSAPGILDMAAVRTDRQFDGPKFPALVKPDERGRRL